MRHYFVTNIQKHGNACVVNLHSWYTQESVILELTDGGKGNVIIVLVNTNNQLSKIWQQIQTRKQVMKPEFINYELR